MKEIDMDINTQRIVSIIVSALEAKKYPDFFDIFLTKKEKFITVTS